MAGPAERTGYEGAAQIAHAIRRSMAVYAAVSLTDSSATREEVEAEAEYWARWIGGSALQTEQTQQAVRGQPLGKAWPPED